MNILPRYSVKVAMKGETLQNDQIELLRDYPIFTNSFKWSYVLCM